MIKNLRIKFVSITMALLGIVLLAVFTIIAISNQQQLARESIQMMERQLSMENNPTLQRPQIGRPQDDFNRDPPGPSENEPVRIIPFVTVTVDENLNIRSEFQENATISRDVLKTAIDAAASQPQNTGIIKGQSLRYMKKETENSQLLIIFADRSAETASMRTLILTLALIFLCTLGVFFVICILLSRWALKPVETAWQNQKQFIADASHELKTPLTVILTNLGILNGHKNETIRSQEKWLDNTCAEAQRMKKLVENLLFLARSDASEIPVSKSSFNLSEALWSVLLPFETYAFEQGLAIEENIPGDITCYGDAGQLRQLTAILLDNGCKYAAKGSTIRLTLEKAADKILLSVHNTGSFIPPEDISHIFDRFYRTDKNRSHPQGSYGLGLAIAKSIVERHHGRISVKSHEKEGTVFTVSLPVTGKNRC